MMAPSFSSIWPAPSAPKSSDASCGSSSFSADLSACMAFSSSNAMTDLLASLVALAVFFLAFASRSAACAASRAALMEPAMSVLNTESTSLASVMSMLERMFMRPVSAVAMPLTRGAAKPAMVALSTASEAAKRSFSCIVSARWSFIASRAPAMSENTNAFLASALILRPSLSMRPSASAVDFRTASVPADMDLP